MVCRPVYALVIGFFPHECELQIKKWLVISLFVSECDPKNNLRTEFGFDI